jgi:hypothetical protein
VVLWCSCGLTMLSFTLSITSGLLSDLETCKSWSGLSSGWRNWRHRHPEGPKCHPEFPATTFSKYEEAPFPIPLRRHIGGLMKQGCPRDLRFRAPTLMRSCRTVKRRRRDIPLEVLLPQGSFVAILARLMVPQG